MGIAIKTFDEMVDSILDRIIVANIGYNDKSKSTVLRTIVEAVVSELDIQYYQLEYVYDSIFIDLATGDDLDRLVAILNVFRTDATFCTGVATLSRSTPASYDIPIQKGKILSTRQNVNGISYNFVVNENKVLTAGSTSVSVQIIAQSAGYLSIPQHQLSIMNNPIMGIDTVDNIYMISGGSDREDDISLRHRAKLALQKMGKATNDALEGAILDIDGVETVSVLDMHRGVGTTDVIVQCSVSPIPQELQDQILQIALKTKASGVHLQVLYPTAVYVDVSVSITSDADVTDAVGKAILEYFKSLGNNDPLIIKQLENRITSVSGVTDMETLSPSSNVPCTDIQVIRSGNITINGEAWTNG